MTAFDILDTDPGDEPSGKVMQLHKTLPPTVEQQGALRRALCQVTDRPLPSRRQVRESAAWWGLRLARLAPWLPVLGWRELRPILRGLGRVASAWAAWVAATDRKEAAKLGEGNVAAKLGTSASKTASARGLISLGVFAAWSGAWVWAWFHQVGWAVTATILVLAVLDFIGHAGSDTPEQAVVLPTGPLVEGFPLSSLRAEIQASFEAQGVETTVGMPFPVEHGWTVEYHSTFEMKDEYIRQLERDLNIRRNGITQIIEKGKAARGVLHVLLRDPLGKVLPSPDCGELTIHRPLSLGQIASGSVWHEEFLRTHFAAVGRSQSGKSSWFWQVVDQLRRCPDVELDAIDLTGGPVFSACRRAFRKRAFDDEAAHKILDDAVRLCMTRNRELQRLAEADDTPDEFEEKWYPTADDPQRTVLIDEFSMIAVTKEEVSKDVSFECTLLGKVEFILRFGAKAAVTVGMASQGGTLDDWGTSIVRDMAMLKVMFACGRSDVLWMLGKDARDSGYRPDLLEPANGGEINDAGKCYAQSASSTVPEARRAYRLDQAEVRRRDRELGARDHAAGSVDAVEVPAVLVLLERVAAGRDFVPTQEVLDTPGCPWVTAKALANAAGEWKVSPDQHRDTKVRGYWLAHVQRTIRGL